jgi:hypothetical protein
VTPSVLEIGSTSSDNKGTLRVTTTSSCSWKVTGPYGGSYESWVTANPTSGTGNGSITITGSDYGLGGVRDAERSAQILIKNELRTIAGISVHQTRSAQSSATALLTVIIDDSCTGKVTDVTVYVDGVSIGTTQPGGALDKTVSVGNHTVEAQANTGGGWAETTYDVPSNGLRLTLTC